MCLYLDRCYAYQYHSSIISNWEKIMIKKVNGTPAIEKVNLSAIENRITKRDNFIFRKYKFKSLLVLGTVLLAIISIFSITFLVMWWISRPDLTQVISSINNNTLDVYKTLQQEHIEQFKNIVALILTPFFPILTLVIGFIVGREVRN